MQGSQKVINELNRALSAELSAIVQYMVQAEMCEAWGYAKLAAATKKRAIEEMHHGEGLIERILFLEGKPAVEIPLTPKIGDDPKAQLELDLHDETDAIKQYNAAVAVCVAEGDNGTRQLFLKMIEDEENHADYLETQLDLIGKLGIQNYLVEQM
jgi:bacterioferritin